MGENLVWSASNVYFSLVLFTFLLTLNVSAELSTLRGSGNSALSENHAPEWTTIEQHAARGAAAGVDTPFVGRQTSNANNISLNQLAENLNRVEGNLASLIQSFLALQRSVFNLEQLQELLVLLLEDILKQSGTMDPGMVNTGSAHRNGNPTSGISNESPEEDDNEGVDSPTIDEDGEDTSLVDNDHDNRDDDSEEYHGGTNGGNTKGNENGARGAGGVGKPGGGGNKNKETDPFGALHEINTASTTPHKQPSNQEFGENQTPAHNEQPPSSGNNNNNYKHNNQVPHSRESSSESREMVGGKSNSEENINRVLPRVMNDVNAKLEPPNHSMRESVIPRKPQINNEPLVTFTSQMEARLYDMVRRLMPSHDRHNQQMASLRQQHHQENSGLSPASTLLRAESPLDIPPRFEPLEIVAAVNQPALPAKHHRLIDDIPVKVRLQQEMSPIISHGGPLVGPEDFSSPFMEHFDGGQVKATGESLNEQSTGMINNMIHLDQTVADPSVNTMHKSRQSPSRPVVMPSVTDRRKRRQIKTEQTMSSDNYKLHLSNSSRLTDDHHTIQITFVNLNSTAHNEEFLNTSKSVISLQESKDKTMEVNNTTSKNKILKSNHTKVFSTNSPKPINQFPKSSHNAHSSTETIPQMLTTLDDFDFLIAQLLNDLSLHLQKQYLDHKHDASVGKDLDKAVLELNNLIWIPSTTASLPQHSTPGHSNTIDSRDSTGKVKLSQSTVQVLKSTSTAVPQLDTLKIQTPQNSGNGESHPLEQVGNFIDNQPTKYHMMGHDDATSDLSHSGGDEGHKKTSISSSTPSSSTTQNATGSINTYRTLTTPSFKSSYNVAKHDQWGWLRQLPLIGQHKVVNMERLIHTLSTLSQHTIFSEELKAITDRGKQLTKDRRIHNQKDEDKTSQEEDESLSGEKNQGLTNGEDSSEDFHYTTDIVQLNDDFNSVNDMKKEEARPIDGERVLGTMDDANVDDSDRNIDNNDTESKNIDDHMVISSDQSSDNTGLELDSGQSDSSMEQSDEEDETNEHTDESKESKADDSENMNNPNDEDNADQIDEALTEKQSIATNQRIKKKYDETTGKSSEDNVNISDEDDDKNDNDNKYDVRYIEEENSDETSSDDTNHSYDVQDSKTQDTEKVGPQSKFNDAMYQLYHNQFQSQNLGGMHNIDNINQRPSLHEKLVHRLQQRKKRRAIPSFWDFLYGNRAQTQNHPTQLFGTHTFGQSQNLQNPFSFHQPNFQDKTGLTNNLQLGNQHPINNPLTNLNRQSGNFPSLNTPNENSPLDINPPIGNAHFQQSQPGNNHLHSTHLGHSPLQPFGKPSFPSLNQQPPQSVFPSSPMSQNFPFHHPPIGGYPQYHGYSGFHYPQFGYPGNQGSQYEPGESPAAEAAADMEEILTNLFNRYWENVRRLLTTKGPPAPPEVEYEGPITTKTAVTTKLTTMTVTTNPTTTIPTTSMTTQKLTTLSNTTTASRYSATTTSLPKTTTINSTMNAYNTSQILDLIHRHNTTLSNMNSTFSSLHQSQSNLNTTNNNTVTSSDSTSLPTVNLVTNPNPKIQPNRTSTLLFHLIKSLEMMTRKPTVQNLLGRLNNTT